MKSLINFNESYTFNQYFELKIDAEDLVENFGYNFLKKYLKLPELEGKLERLEQTK